MNKHVKVLGEMFQQCANERRMKEADALSAAIAALGQGEAVGDAYWHHDGDGTSEMRVNWYGTPPASGTPLYTHAPQPVGPEGVPQWTDDCQGKADFDGVLVRVSSRYWPGNYRQDGKPSAQSSIHTTEREIATYKFAGESEREVKDAVEAWVKNWVSALAAPAPEAQPQGEKCCGYANPITGNCYTCGKPALECLQASFAKDSEAGQGMAVIELTGVDEYGPMLAWHRHWVEFPIGTKFRVVRP